MKKPPLVPRIYVKDVSLLWTALWIMSHHPLPNRIRETFGRTCPLKFWRRND